MRYYISLIAVTVIGISVFTACQQTSPSAELAKVNPAPTANSAQNSNSAPKSADPLADAPRITLADAKKAFDEGKVVFVDTRADVKYKEEHIKGAMNIPAEAFQTRYAEVPKDKKIITYCS